MKLTAGRDDSDPLVEHVVAGLRQCGLLHSARVEEQPRTDLRVRQPIPSESRDLPLLRSQLIASLDPALACCLASRQQLTPGTLGERLRTHVKKQPHQPAVRDSLAAKPGTSLPRRASPPRRRRRVGRPWSSSRATPRRS